MVLSYKLYCLERLEPLTYFDIQTLFFFITIILLLILYVVSGIM